jgi:hypothetical protein
MMRREYNTQEKIIFMQNLERKKIYGRPKIKCEDTIKTDIIMLKANKVYLLSLTSSTAQLISEEST